VLQNMSIGILVVGNRNSAVRPTSRSRDSIKTNLGRHKAATTLTCARKLSYDHGVITNRHLSATRSVWTGSARFSVRGKSLITLTVAGLLCFAAPLFAHHGNNSYDSGKRITQKGIVTQWIWSNPHCFLRYDVKDENGQVVHWLAETQAPINMISGGWRQTSLKPGDEITITIEPMKNGRTAGRIEYVTLPNGTTLHGQTEFKEDQFAPRK